jgi:hypothetical protein
MASAYFSRCRFVSVEFLPMGQKYNSLHGNADTVIVFVSRRIAFCEFLCCNAMISGGVASTAQSYTVELTTSTSCVATRAGAFCFLHVANEADAAITYVSASLSDAPEGSVYCHSGFDAGRVNVTGLNSSFNHAQLANAYYIGRHISLSVLGCFFHSNTDGNCLRLSFGGESDESTQEVNVTCLSLVNNRCWKTLSGIEGRGLVWFRANAKFTSCLFMKNTLGVGEQMFHTCRDELECPPPVYGSLVGLLTLQQCIFDTDNGSLSGNGSLTFTASIVIPTSDDFAPCITASPTQTVSLSRTASPLPSTRALTSSKTQRPTAWRRTDELAKSRPIQSGTFTPHWEAVLCRRCSFGSAASPCSLPS